MSAPNPRYPAWDADMECKHGRMPFDPSDVCGCFPVEAGAIKPRKRNPNVLPGAREGVAAAFNQEDEAA